MSYEEVHGKVELPRGPAHSRYDDHGRLVSSLDGADELTAANVSRRQQQQQQQEQQQQPPLWSYAAWYLCGETYTSEVGDNLFGGLTASDDGIHHTASGAALRSLVTAEYFKNLSSSAARQSEADLWSLVEDLLLDAERARSYDPDAIGIADVQPQRRWFLSQYAHLQDLLMRHPVLRRACIICRWLERTYRSTRTERSSQLRLRGEDDVVLQQLLLSYIRGGELHRAIDAAVTYRDCRYSCVLGAAQLQTVKEPWLLRTALVPLFGEYAHGELDQSWCGNEHRLDNLSQLFEESTRPSTPGAADRVHEDAGTRGAGVSAGSARAQGGLDAVIGAALCGNSAVLEPTFLVSCSWRDLAWCYLRCTLTVAFTKTLLCAGAPMEGGAAYRNFVESQAGADGAWAEQLERRLVAELTQRLAGPSGFLGKVSTEEDLQIRVILQVLSPDDASWLDVHLTAPSAGSPAWGAESQRYDESTRVLAHLLLVMDAAYNETLSSHAVQAQCGATLARALAQYAERLARLAHGALDERMAAVTVLALRLHDYHYRAQVYVSFLQAARAMELERQTLSRERLEEQEARLIRVFLDADGESAVHAEVQRLLNQQVPAEELLTHSKLAESILWKALHADTVEDYRNVLRDGLHACAEFWQTEPRAELDAIADVARILVQRVIPFLSSSSPSPLSDASTVESLEAAESASSRESAAAAAGNTHITALESSEVAFWQLLSECRALSQQHTKTAGELGAARAAGSKIGATRMLLYELAQEETASMRALQERTRAAVVHGGAVVHRSLPCLTAVTWLVQGLVEDATVSMLNSDPQRDELFLVQCVFELVEQLDEAGYLDPELLPQRCAEDLFNRIRTMRVTYGQRAHRKHVREVQQSAAAVSTATEENDEGVES